MVNTTCPTSPTEYSIKEEPLWKSVKFHHVGLLVCAVFGAVAIGIAFFLMYQHATHYSRPWEQKHIIRILFMIPIYAMVSFLSYVFYKHATYYEVIRDCYEAFAIASFFTLLCHYIAPNLHDQKDYFRGLKPKNWVWPAGWFQKCSGGTRKGWLRIPRSGLTWFNIIWISIFQYCFIRVFFTIVSVVTEAFDVYCEASLMPWFAHVWVMCIEGASVTVAMYCLIQFYVQMRVDLAEHKPFLKVLCIKLVIFFSFWQSILVSFLSSDSGPLQPTKKLAYTDIKVGIPSMLLCVEMAIFAAMHLFAFSWKPYSLEHGAVSDPLHSTGVGFSGSSPTYEGGRFGMRAFMDAFNPWDIIKASARGFRWLFVGARKRELDPSYHVHQDSIIKPATGGPTFAGNGEQATELSNPYNYKDTDTDGAVDNAYNPIAKPSRFQAESYDDRAGLLSHAQGAGHLQISTSGQGYSNVPSPMNSSVDSENDLGTMDQPHNRYPGGGYYRPSPQTGPTGSGVPYPESIYEQDTGYHGAAPAGIPPRDVLPARQPGSVAPAHALHGQLWGSAPPPGQMQRPPQHDGYDR